MSAAIRKLVLLPGMDGTGKLFAEFVNVLPREFEATIISYPTDNFRSYDQLKEQVLASLPVSEPFALLAESFSTPLAIQCAAADPPNLKACILCAGFARSPLLGPKRILASLLAPVAIRIKLRTVTIRKFLVGDDAPESLLQEVQDVVSSVRPAVLLARLRSILACDALRDLARINVSLLYLRAANDRLVPARCADEIVSVKPRATVISIPGPHLVLQREPKTAAEAVSNFLRKMEKSSA